ncbi:serine/threonine protein kinase [Pseudanabaena sp. FACHB-1998]|uniref:serine/threonine protein kinase n=1 Tax=Pseudanabaena sp. FACHB-1998 TaxID=2692858 RepID=UPI00168116D7|nr:serine/threonine-protein kinase [Pseudanabaena sp. FACHB-1998]MBD2176505.1 serine/threonine protein kinase [Pseudanabaena sp. FACHB-1998]
MSTFPDLSAHGYQVIKELGHNLEGGRFTYLAKRFADNAEVVIKQFQFSKGTGWDGFRAIEREIQSLQGLSHRGIPKYLDKFETDSGYCLVTEYFPADTLAVGRSFTPDQIKQIAVQLLEILVYLQERMPPVIHRDVKPENILVDHNLNVYLIDFGFARVGSGSVAMSSAAAGTFGFMAPEQIRNLKLTNASDLYGLGLTLICLIGAIRSTDIGNYIDFSNQLDRSKIDPKLKGCSLTFVKWLDQMVAPDPSKRFADAKVALETLKPLYVVRVPEVKFFKDGVEFDPSKITFKFKAKNLGEKMRQTITLKNSIPETVLEGCWEVAPHPNDPPHTPDSHAWISFNKQKFKGNDVNCEITVHTSKLRAGLTGSRQVVFRSNTNQGQINLLLEIETANPLPKIPLSLYFEEVLYFGCVLVSGVIAIRAEDEAGAVGIALAGSVALAVVAMAATRAVAVGICLEVVGVVAIAWTGAWAGAVVWTAAWIWAGAWAGGKLDEKYKSLSAAQNPSFWMLFWSRYVLALLCGCGLGMNIFGMGLIKGFFIPATMIPIVTIASGAGLFYLTILPMLQRQSQLASYRKKEQHLIKP